MISQVIATAYGALLTIAAVSGLGVSPIQITTAVPHNYGNGDWVAVSGVQGNTAANVNDRATIVDTLNFTVPGTGNGAWVAGSGAVALYYGIANGLSLAGHAPLITASVNVGPEYLAENNDLPRIVFVPTVAPFVGRAAFNSMGLIANGPNPAINTTAPIMGRVVTGQVHCWGIDYDDAMALGDQFIRSMMWTLTSGNFTASEGVFTEKTLVAERGREFVFTASWIESVSALPVTLSGAGTTHVGEVYIDNAGNATGTTPVLV